MHLIDLIHLQMIIIRRIDITILYLVMLKKTYQFIKLSVLLLFIVDESIVTLPNTDKEEFYINASFIDVI